MYSKCYDLLAIDASSSSSSSSSSHEKEQTHVERAEVLDVLARSELPK